MANENWQLLGDKMRNYRPAVDADAAWRDVVGQLEVTPQPMGLLSLLGWKLAEMTLLLLSCLIFSWSTPPVANDFTEPSASVVAPQVLQEQAPETPAISAFKARQEETTLFSLPTRPQGSAKRALPPSADRTTEEKSVPISPGSSRSSTAVEPNSIRQTDIPAAKKTSPTTTASVPVAQAVEPNLQLRATGPVVPLSSSLPQGQDLTRFYTLPLSPAASVESGEPSIAPVALELLAGGGQTAAARIAPFVGVQLRYYAGPRSALVLGAAYQRVSGMNLHWHQAEYHKDYGYPTGNSVDRWLDSYGAWEYSIDYRRQVAGRLAVQTGVQLTVLQERGLREQVQGSDFFLGSSRRSLVDRDFGLRLGLDYRLSRHFAVFAQYLQGLGDISPDHLYEQQTLHRHGGFRIGLRLVPFKANY